jgi:hypothetical protein
MKSFGLAEEKSPEQKFVLFFVAEAVVILYMLGNNGMIKSFLGKKQFVLSLLIKIIVPPDNRRL